MTMNGARSDALGSCLAATTRHDHEALAAVFRALADPARLQIVHSLAAGERRVGDLVSDVGLAQSTTSAHLAVLREAGLVSPRAVGRATYYSLTTDSLGALLQRAEELLTDGLDTVVHSHEPQR
jgi:ArsR family transcriptional regulator, cadmium/lead-responsive transcriptional repressor